MVLFPFHLHHHHQSYNVQGEHEVYWKQGPVNRTEQSKRLDYENLFKKKTTVMLSHISEVRFEYLRPHVN